MVNLFCIMLPCAICLLFAFLFGVKANKTNTDKIFMLMALCAGTYFFAEFNYISRIEDYNTWIIADILSQYARPLVPPLMVLGLKSMMGKCTWRWYTTLAFAISIVIGTVSMCVYIIMGFDNAANYIDAIDEGDGHANGYEGPIYWLHQIFCVWLYRITAVIYALIAIARIGYLFYKTKFKFHEITDFLFHGGEIEPAHIEGMLFIVILTSILIKISIGKYFFIDNQCCASIFCIFRTAIVFCLGHVALRANQPTLSLYSLRNNHAHKTEHEETEAYDQNNQNLATDECVQIDRFNEIKDKHLFITPGISIEACAEKIGTNRTYLSKYISANYNCTFREYITLLRIEYSKQYMLTHKDDKQEMIAEACGFSDASSFNKKFKQIVGKTPRMWLAM